MPTTFQNKIQAKPRINVVIVQLTYFCFCFQLKQNAMLLFNVLISD